MKHSIIFCLIILLRLPAYTQTKYDLQFSFEGKTRELIVSVPTKQPPVDGYPAVFMLHGTSGDKDVFYNVKGWKELGQEENFITVFPSSLKWCFTEDGAVKNTSRFVCGGLLDSICPAEVPRLIDDVAFFRKIVELLEDTISLDKKKIFISGFSNGSCMAHKIALDAGDLFSAASGSSSPLHALDSITPQKRIPFWYMVGTKDDRYFSPIYPDELPFGGDSVLFYHFKAINRALVCQGLTQKFRKEETLFSKTYIWTECRPGEVCAPYLFTVNKDQKHQYPNGNNYPLDAPKLFWNFFNNPPETTVSSHTYDTPSNTSIIIIPNPANEKIEIIRNSEESIMWDCEILNMQGKIVKQKAAISENYALIDIHDLIPGIYITIIREQKRVTFRKMVKY